MDPVLPWKGYLRDGKAPALLTERGEGLVHPEYNPRVLNETKKNRLKKNSAKMCKEQAQSL